MTAAAEVIGGSPEGNGEGVGNIEVTNSDVVVDAIEVDAIAIFPGSQGGIIDQCARVIIARHISQSSASACVEGVCRNQTRLCWRSCCFRRSSGRSVSQHR